MTLSEIETYTDVMPARRVFPPALVAAALVAAGSVRAEAQPNQRSMFVSVLDRSGAPVPDLGPADFIVREDNVAREVVAATPATDPMQIEVLVDTSDASQPYIADLRRALPPFLERLVGSEPGRRNEVGLVTLGDRPTILARPSVDAAVLKGAAERLFAQGGAGTYLLDGIVEVCRGFAARAATRPVVVAITTEGPEFSSTHFADVLGRLRETGAAFHVVVVGPAGADAGDEAQNRSVVLDRGPKVTGGRFAHILSGMALGSTLTQLADELTHQYRVTFGRPPALIPPETTTVSAARPGVVVRGTLVVERDREGRPR
ncbi:MAG: hypothetical protein IT176_10785 [Acidobacteria bacterium]|nr:hypothetical protein [Acidobacteriota bacterium]